MSQVSFKELEIVRLSNENKFFESLTLKRERERKSWEAKFQEFESKNDKLEKQVTGKFDLQGAEHIM